MEFAEYLKKLRENNKLSIRQLALYSDVSAGYLSQIENGSRGIPSPEVLKKLYKPLKVSYEELMKAAGYLDDNSDIKMMENQNSKIIGENLKKYREKAKLTKEEAAEKLNVSQTTYAEYESGKAKPDEHIIKEAANLYGVKEEKLLLADDIANENPINRAFHNYDDLTQEEIEYLKMQLEIFRKMKKKK